MLTEQQDILLKLVKASLVGEIGSSADFAKTDWSAVMEEAAQHAITGQLFAVVEDNYANLNISIEQKLNLYALTMKIQQQNEKLNKVLYQLVKRLDEAKLPCILLKGQGCAQLQKKPMYRASGDIDLLVGNENFDTVMSCLKGSGLVEGCGHEDNKHSTIFCDGIAVEIHRFADTLPGKKNNARFLEATDVALRKSKRGFFVSEDGQYKQEGNAVFVRTMPVELDAVYVFIHMFRHFIQGGVRLIQVCDWLFLCKHIEDKEQTERWLRSFGFLHTWQIFSQMAVEYIGLPAGFVPACGSEDDRKAGKAMDILMERSVASVSVNNKGLWARVGEVLVLYHACFRAFGIFPKECLFFLWDIMSSNIRKHVFGML